MGINNILVIILVCKKFANLCKLKTKQMMNIKAIANEIIRLGEESAQEAGELITNLKLQKLLYYEQGYFLAAFGKPLFDEEIEAWVYGPAVPCLYEEYNSHGRLGLIHDPGIPKPEFECEEQSKLFYDVFDIYNQYSAIGLMRMSHFEKPWQSVPARKGSVISKSLMLSFFQKNVEA